MCIRDRRPTSDRIVIVFSDEVEQSYLRDLNDPEGPNRPITKAIVEDAARAGINLKVYAFSTGGGFGNQARFWEDLTLAGNGALFDLTSNAVSMYNDLMSIIDEACLPREEEQEQEQEQQGAMMMPIMNNQLPALYYSAYGNYANTSEKIELSIPRYYHYDTKLQYCVEPEYGTIQNLTYYE